jgi:hypothetical protein
VTISSAAGPYYDAFISYRSESSGAHARALRDGLMAMDRRRADREERQGAPMRVFLDHSSLLTGSLSDNLRAGIARSRHLVVLLDDMTFRSVWVDREIGEWLGAGGTPDRLFMVRTSRDLDLTWDEDRGAYLAADLLPVSLREMFSSQQKHVDFLGSPRRIDDVDLVGLYSSIMGVDPETTGEGERRYLRQQRTRSRRTLSVLALLLAVSLVTAGLAIAGFQRADTSSQQARADAMAAQSLLELPVNPARSIELALEASQLADSTSIRSTLLTVASETRTLRGTYSLTKDGDARSVTGLSLRSDGTAITAWGSSSGGDETRVVTWDVVSGQVLQKFGVPRQSISSLVEVPGVAYIGCAGNEAMQIDWRAHSITQLAVGGNFCDAKVFGGGGTIEYSSGKEDDGLQIMGVTFGGESFTHRGSLADGSESDSLRVIVDDGGYAVAIVAPDGMHEIPGVDQGPLVGVQGARVYVNNLRGKVVVMKVSGGRVSDSQIEIPSTVTAVAAWLDDVNEPTGDRAAWLTADGEIGWSGDQKRVVLPKLQPLLTNIYAPTLTLYDYHDVLATFGDMAYKISFGVQSGSFVLGRLDSPSANHAQLAVKACPNGAAILGENSYIAPGGEVMNAHAILQNCSTLELGPPIRVNGTVALASAIADPGTSVVSQSGSLFMGREGGIVSEYVASDASVVPWQVISAGTSLAAPDRVTTLYNGNPLVIGQGSEHKKLGRDASGDWRLASPDGEGGVFSNSGVLWVTNGSDIPRMVSPSCSSGLRFEPSPGFLTDAVAASTPMLVARYGSNQYDCVTGAASESASLILDYFISGSGGHVVSLRNGTLSFTEWSKGDSRSVTREVPDVFGRANVAVSDVDGTSVVVNETGSDELIEYKWDGHAWLPGLRFAGDIGLVASASFSKDGSLLMSISSGGRFDIFDTVSGRRLASQTVAIADSSTKFTTLTLQEGGGYINAYLGGDKGATLVRIPVGRAPLRQVLCAVHQSSGC